LPSANAENVVFKPLKKAQLVAPVTLAEATVNEDPWVSFPVTFKAGKPWKAGAEPLGQAAKKGLAKVTMARGSTGVSNAVGNGDSPLASLT
jgi:hypothetical protein